jgi:enoyl-CoA hydratase/isomerase-like protein
VRAVVLTGAGGAFSVAGDVKAMNATIAAIVGPAAGAGLSLARACDFRVRSQSAKLTTAFAKVGLSGDCGHLLPAVHRRTRQGARALSSLSRPHRREGQAYRARHPTGRAGSGAGGRHSLRCAARRGPEAASKHPRKHLGRICTHIGMRADFAAGLIRST